MAKRINVALPDDLHEQDYFAPYIKRGIELANEALKRKDLPYSTLVMLEGTFGGENEGTYDIDNAYVKLAGALMDDPDLFTNYIKNEFTPGEDPAILNYLAAGFIIGVLKIWEELEI